MSDTACTSGIVKVRDLDPEVRQKLRELDYAERVVEAAEDLDAVLAGLNPNAWGWSTKAQRRAFLTARQALLQRIHNYRLSRVVEDASYAEVARHG
jgi:hypothetical protein